MAIQIIEEQEQLSSVTEKLEQKDRIAIDLEFDKNYYRYGFNLCLMQIYDGSTCYLLDPLSGDLDIKAIFPVLENENIEKVAFAFGEDLRLLHSIGCFPENVYDLDNAISLLNYPPASLTNHLKRILDIETGQSSQMSNWYERPLSDQQIQYAAEDVKYLFALHDKLVSESQQKEVEPWINQENRAITRQNFADEESSSFLKHKDKKEFSEREWHLYANLMEVREQLAESLNKPAFKVIKKEILADIARNPRQLKNWENTRGIHPRLRNAKIREKLTATLKESQKSADSEGLKDSEPANKPLSTEEFEQQKQLRMKVNQAKQEFFNPIKNQIEMEYGKEVSTFLFSNRIIGDLISRETPEMLPYKSELLIHYADKLDLEIDKYLEL